MKKRFLKVLLFIPAIIATFVLLPIVVVFWMFTGELFKSRIETLVNL